MSRNRLAIAIAALMLGAVTVVLLEPLGQSPTDLTGTESSSADSDLANANGPPSSQNGKADLGGFGRIEDQNDSATGGKVALKPQELGIPSFQGKVIDPQNQAVVNAEITAYGMPGRARGFDPNQPQLRPFAELRATTDTRGRFQLAESPHEGLRWLLRIEHEGYPLFELADLSSIPGRSNDLGLLQLQNPASIQGQVTDPDGYPLLNAKVIAMRGATGLRLSNWLEADRFPLPGATAMTARDGDFSIGKLPPGPIRLQASAPGFVAAISAEAQLQTGQELRGLQLVLQRSLPLRGVVTSMDGGAIAGAKVWANFQPPSNAETWTDAGGHFALELPANATRIRLEASAPNFGHYQQNFKKDPRGQSLEIRLVQIMPLHGRVLDANGNGIASAHVGLFEQSRMRLARVAPQRSSPVTQTVCNKDGSFQIGVDPTASADPRMRLVAWAEGYHAAASNTLRFEQRNGKVPLALEEEIILRLPNGSTLSGTVTDEVGNASAGARVHLRRHGGIGNSSGLAASLAARDGEITAVTTANSLGGYSIPDLAPGVYHLEAIKAGYSPGRCDEFHLEAEQSLQVDLQLSTAAGIRGQIFGDASRMGKLRLLAISEDGRIYNAEIQASGSAATSNYQMEELPPGTFRLELYASTATAQGAWGRPLGPKLCDPVLVLVSAGQITAQDLHLDFEQLAAIHGSVLVNGYPSPDYRIFLIPAGMEGSEDKEQRRQIMDRVRSTNSNFDGKYSFEGLAADEFWLVLAPPLQSANANVGVTALTGSVGGWISDDGPRGLARTRLELDGGERARHDFYLVTSALAGTAVRATRNGVLPLKSGIGSLSPGPELQGLRRFTFAIRADGSFQVPAIPAGNWLLELRSGSYQLKRQTLTLTPGGLVKREFVLNRVKEKDQEKK
ncbi:MAG: carboxypeptidase regulatory-like domain-containing protein [Planctomycetes bacterium]|nr:carboxypeptidase regulatory-like domain-containing protein [Planctomycetota bacterium]